MNHRVEDLKRALLNMSRDDLNELTIEELDRLESDLNIWAGLAFVASMSKRAAIRDEASE